jgi:hypothetical protein
MTATKKKKPLKGGTNDTDKDGFPLSFAEPNATINGHALDSDEAKEAVKAAVKAAIDTLPVAETIPADGTPSPLNPANAYDSPEALAAWDKETAELVSEFNGKVSDLESEWETSHTITAAKKKVFEASLDELRSLIRDRRANRGKPPTPKPAKLYADPDATAEGSLPNVPADDAWKAIPLTELAEHDGFPAYLVEKLANAARKDDRPCPPIVTLGDLTAFTEPEASGYTKKLSDIVGIGAGAVDKITDATIAFWQRWAKEGRGVPQSGASHEGESGDGSDDSEAGDEDGSDADAIAEPRGLPD